MSYIVKDWRRFDSPNKQTEGLQGWQTVVEQNTAEGKARTVFCGTQKCRIGIFALTVC